MGVLLGGFIEGDPAELEGATSYLAFVVPGLVAAHAMQTAVGETTYPVMGDDQVAAGLRLDARHAAPDPRTSSPPTCCFVRFRLATTCAVFMLVLAPFGVFETWWGPFLAFVSQVLVGMAFATAGLRLHRAADRPRTASACCSGSGSFPLFLFSGAFFPVANLGEVGAWVARLTPLWHGVNLSRMFCLDTVDWSLAAVNVAVLLALTVVRLVLVGDRPDEAAGEADGRDRRAGGARRSRRSPGRRRCGCWCCATTSSTARLEALPHRLPRAGLLPVLDRHRRRPADRSPSSSTASRSRTPRSSRPACSPPRRSTAR